MARGDWGRAVQVLEDKGGPGGRGLPPREAILLGLLHGLRGDLARASTVLLEVAERREAGAGAEALFRLALLRLSTRTAPLDEVTALIDRAAALPGLDPRVRAIECHARSQLHWKRGQVAEAGARLLEARRILEEVGDEEELAKVLDSLARYREHCGDRERALSCYSLSLSKKTVGGDLHGMAITLGNLGRLHLKAGDPESALAFLKDDLRIAEQIGDAFGQIVVRTNVAQACI